MRSGAAANAALWLESKMGHQGPTRQLQSQPLLVAITDVRHGAGRVDKRDIAHSQGCSPIVLTDR
jgi:hypothetical protein